ncbi:glycosyltransferase [Cupriavidus taiwanensis]|uniref:glycosyltransferase n=1 Tax=Cupriavidus taiwanensis TaxID=164546 RepID=UPI002541BC8F|nr:glycosyltransferase [Cupriavidus taiwanensis]MDK3026294.1 glycosyltransferase [Cupriavidus taiwanensis]
MRLILFGHPVFFGSHSMDRFAAMIVEGMRERGHEAQLWTPPAVLVRLSTRPGPRKWLGYLDQYVLFPAWAWWRLRREGAGALVVLTDHSLGMWMWLLHRRPHVIHCHDFIAQRTAAGEFPGRQLSASGRLYQALILRGVGLGRNFVAVSDKTAQDLLRLHPGRPPRVRVVHNGLNYPFRPLAPDVAMRRLRAASIDDIRPGMLVHIGGNQWYKNREGVLALYQAYCEALCAGAGGAAPRPLWMIGPEPTPAMRELAAGAEQLGGEVRFLEGMSTAAVHAAYALAAVLLFPSLEEGFGWPVIEAMACGIPVLTTARAPMQEIGGGLALLMEPMEAIEPGQAQAWARRNVGVLLELLSWPQARLDQLSADSLAWARHFSAERALDQYEAIYQAALAPASAAETAEAGTAG